MGKLIVRINSYVLTIFMALVMFGVMHTPPRIAYACEADSALQASTDNDSGVYALADSEYETHIHNGIEFKPWTDSTRMPNEPGHFYLTQDVTLSKRWTVPRTYVDICLNGHTVTTTDPYDIMIYVSSPSGSNVNLSIFDCEGGSGEITGSCYNAVYVDNNCVFNLHGGRIAGNDCAAVLINSDGVFNMDGGSITDNYGPNGVVSGLGRFNMTGGSIVDNDGAGVCVNEFHVSGSPIISGNALEVDSDTHPMNVVINSDHMPILVDGPLSASAFIGVEDMATTPLADDEISWPVVFTRGLPGNGSAGNFFSDLGLAFATNDAGEAVAYIPQV